MPLTYSEYLKIDPLLKLQNTKSEDHDEMLFIIVHQVYELWFKQILFEMKLLQSRLEEGSGPPALKTLKRILTILKVMVSQVDVIETMTPLEFNSFRSRLESSSGFQSSQFREFEFRLGKRNSRFLEQFEVGSEARNRLEGLMNSKSLFDSFLIYLKNCSYKIEDSAFTQNGRVATDPHPETQKVLLKIYNSDPGTTQICEMLVDLDEGIQEWRYRHVKMVERTIGAKMGTGGSMGAEYLRKTLFTPIFPDLWDIRSQF